MSSGAPFEYSIYNRYNASISPSTVHTKNSALYEYFVRYLMQRAMSVFKWTMPTIWEQRARNYMLYVLYCWGFIGILNTPKFGTIPQECTLMGYDVFYQPSGIAVANELIGETQERTIGKDCVLLRLQPDYGGITDIVSYYADQLALLSEAVSVNAVNSKLSFMFGARDKAPAESLKKAYDEYSAGNPAVFYDKNLLDPKTGALTMQFFNKDVRNSYIISDLLKDIRSIMDDFDAHIGIPNANTQKKERMIVDEVNANNFETRSMCELWLENLRTGCEEARKMFGIDLGVDWRSAELAPNAEGANTNADTAINNRAV